jgi:hypothetical protein
MLHERVRDQNEVTREPTSKRNGQRGGKVPARPKSFLAPDQRTDECGGGDGSLLRLISNLRKMALELKMTKQQRTVEFTTKVR